MKSSRISTSSNLLPCHSLLPSFTLSRPLAFSIAIIPRLAPFDNAKRAAGNRKGCQQRITLLRQNLRSEAFRLAAGVYFLQRKTDYSRSRKAVLTFSKSASQSNGRISTNRSGDKSHQRKRSSKSINSSSNLFLSNLAGFPP